MSASVVLNLPDFDTGQYEGCEFVMRGANATLTLHIAELPDVSIRFEGVRWHQFTSLYNCSPDMVRDAYFKLVEYPSSQALSRFISEDLAASKAYSRLSHYRIFLDETGCHDVFAQSAGAI
ncbi:hypothetical protein [uncultured Aquimonas sp.]|uniref:hypothetical protein n=1 Tax=uncultured Aquimonas sp. TaxID=385483 RepID=UPI00086AC669|nr:hypothetical protein [uncultured Aquimonas sp.]ODU45398.1 MAG: hypothetical protein ABS96_15210 [Xanthomonadaceae bacterium SCN 69-123]